MNEKLRVAAWWLIAYVAFVLSLPLEVLYVACQAVELPLKLAKWMIKSAVNLLADGADALMDWIYFR